MSEESKKDVTDVESEVRVDDARQRAIKQIELRRRFHRELFFYGVAIVLLVLIWGMSEYHNAGGWPIHGFSQSSGIHQVWNFWIIYPVLGLIVIASGRAWAVYANKPVSEDEIEREMKREKGSRAA